MVKALWEVMQPHLGELAIVGVVLLIFLGWFFKDIVARKMAFYLDSVSLSADCLRLMQKREDSIAEFNKQFQLTPRAHLNWGL